MSGNIAWGRWTVVSTALVGFGYLLMKATTPSEKEYYDSLAPDLKRKVDLMRAQRQEEEQRRALATNPDTSKPVWADSKKPA